MSDTPRTDALEEKWRYATEARGNLMEALNDMFNEYGKLELELYAVTKERDELKEAFTYLAESGAKLECGYFSGELKWWLEYDFGETREDIFDTPLEAVRAAIEAEAERKGVKQ
jgi:hypothetical protein